MIPASSRIRCSPPGEVAARIAEVGKGRIGIRNIVAAELRYGAAKRGASRLTAQMESVFAALEVLPFETPSDMPMGTCAFGWKPPERRSARMTC